MKRFRFFSWGMAPCKSLPNIFTEKDIKPGMFSPSLEKRLHQAKKHGTRIFLKKWRHAVVGVKVINIEDRQADLKRKKDKLKIIKKKLKKLVKDPDVKSFMISLRALSVVLKKGTNINILPLIGIKTK